MADTNSTQYAKVASANTTYDPLQPNEYLGKVQCSFFQHTCESEGIGDTISLCEVPANARIIRITWASDDLSAGAATLDIGDSGDADRLIEDIDVSSAVAASVQTLRSPSTETPDVGFGYEYTSKTVITATVVAAALNTGKLWGTVEYVAS